MGKPKNNNLSADTSALKSRQSSRPAKPAATAAQLLALAHLPGIASGSVDVTGVIPEGVHVDPEITEGHAGYDESGSSEPSFANR
jgi:hypothetical protein